MSFLSSSSSITGVSRIANKVLIIRLSHDRLHNQIQITQNYSVHVMLLSVAGGSLMRGVGEKRRRGSSGALVG